MNSFLTWISARMIAVVSGMEKRQVRKRIFAVLIEFDLKLFERVGFDLFRRRGLGAFRRMAFNGASLGLRAAQGYFPGLRRSVLRDLGGRIS
jgi:hypothetical protein